jgi:hypothetical protein
VTHGNVTSPNVLGVPVFWSPYVNTGHIWAIPQAKSFVVIRDNPSVVADASAYFSSDRVGIRCTARFEFAHPHPWGIVRIGIGGS